MKGEFCALVAIRGRQGRNSYYLIQCPLRLARRLFLSDEERVRAEVRGGRKANAKRATQLVGSVAEHRRDYIVPPLVVSVDRDLPFEAFEAGRPDAGTLLIPSTARFILLYGPDSSEATQEAPATERNLKSDTVPVMLFTDPELRLSSRQYINMGHEKRWRTLSQRVLQDRENSLAMVVREMINEVPLFKGLVELEKTTISNRSTSLFTLGAIFKATQALLGVRMADTITATQADLAKRFWMELGQVIPVWQQAILRSVPSAELRKQYIPVHSVSLLAIGMAGHALVKAHPNDWKERLSALGQIDWSRSNVELWEGRAMLHGRMSKTRDSVDLTANAIKTSLGLDLTADEKASERKLGR